MSRNTEVSDYIPLLQDLGRAGQGYFLEGGQAVNFWAEYISSTQGEKVLKAFKPYTSIDCDIWVDHPVAAYLASREYGTLIRGTSPADGQLGIFTLHGDPPRRVDLMTGVYGIPPSNHARLIQRTIIFNDVRVMDPLYLFVCKCHCLLELDQTGRQDEKHLRMLSLIIPAYISELLEEASNGNLAPRDIIKEIKLLRKLCKDGKCRRALKQIQTDPQSLVPLEKIKTCGIPLLERFASSLP